MARGLSTVNLANAWLNSMRGGGNGVTFTAPATLFAQLHTGDPGASGTTAVSSTTTRQAMGFGAASAGSMSLSTQPSWTSWAGTNGEVVTDASCHSASSAGTFYFSTQLTASKTVNTGDTITITTWTFSLAPLAA
ncbi:hypothetical protein Ait01nite_032150 [Actinoplanes italicus]|uniref:Uncharacterized protein n=1 Tax=Actinoplanes italicus TaxID=113567 RepID=A0A2T0KJH8_9ACTN|nr:hypothetical protein [Actinoplanes italicus]PRX23668.1 hypothetical protein CLV67_103417 [Actinoplanes italicus]GIE30170.1 hypothetical protein Ait01nite_032150 [Actinoplanes italicus]